jgi:hypothetical protein
VLVLAVKELDKMFAKKIVYIIGHSLLVARESASPPRPFFTVAIVIEAIYGMPSQPSRAENHAKLHEEVHQLQNPLACHACEKRCTHMMN